MNDKFFPIVNLLTCVSAGLVYAYVGDYRRMTYWLAAAAIVVAVTF